jgi:hypothetical protein
MIVEVHFPNFAKFISLGFWLLLRLADARFHNRLNSKINPTAWTYSRKPQMRADTARY